LDNRVVRLPIHPEPVASLAVDMLGEFLVVFQVDSGGTGQLTCFKRAPDGMFHVTERRRVSDPGPYWLTSVMTSEAGESTVGLSNGKEFWFLTGPLLEPSTAWDWSISVEHLCCGVLLAPRPSEGVEVVCLFGQNDVWYTFPQWNNSSRVPLGWTPLLTPGSPLKTPPLAWLYLGSGLLEAAGLGEGGCVRWLILNFRDDASMSFYQTKLSTHDGYLATTLLRSNFLAGVRKSQIEWLRCSDTSSVLTLVSTTPISLPKAVACFPSHPTNELIVVCAEGFVVRVPVPA
jgi:hypothetical protein